MSDPSTLSNGVLWLRAKDLGANNTSAAGWTNQINGVAGQVRAPGATQPPLVKTSATPGGGKAVEWPAGVGMSSPADTNGTSLDFGPIMFTGTDVAAISSSSMYDENAYAVSRIIDGNSGTEWLANSASPIVTVRLKSTKTVTAYTLTCTNNSRAPKTWTFQASNDGSSWTTLDTQTAQTFSGSTPRTFSFTNTTAYLYYRLNVSVNNESSTFTTIYEMSFTGATLAGTMATAGEIWAVVKAPTTNAALWQSSPDNAWFTNVGAGTIYESWGLGVGAGYTSQTPVVTVASTWRLYRIFTNGTTWTSTLDGTTQNTKSSAAFWRPSMIVGGGHYGNPLFGGGRVAEIYARTAVSTSGEVADLITYFNTEHGTSFPGGSTPTPTTTGTAPVSVASSSASVLVGLTTGTAPIAVATSASTSLVGAIPTTTGTAPISVSSSAATSLAMPAVTTGTSPIGVATSASTYTPGSGTSATLLGGASLTVSTLTLLNVVTMTAVTLTGGGTIAVSNVLPVVPMADVTLLGGGTITARPDTAQSADPRTGVYQWRYVVTELDGTPLGELDDISHDPVSDGVNIPTTMKLVMASDDPARALIEADEPMARKCQVWEGDTLLLWGPILPDLEDGDGTAGYTVHDPSWWWRGGRRVIGRFPRLDLLRNGDFKQGLTYWTRGFDADSIPAAPPAVTVVSEDLIDDTDNVDPIKAARIVGVESVTQTSSELSSNAVFWPNLATFRPGGVAAIEAVANAMPTTAGLAVTVVGHTANDGTGNGLDLSLRRANAAKAIIQARRPAAVITTRGVGFYDPKPGYPIDSQAQRRVVISYASTTTVTAKAKQWIKQTVSVSQPKSARYPLELTAAALVKIADDWSVQDANMVTIKVVARRGSAATPWDAQKGVGETSYSDTDPVDRWLSATASATIPADGRTYNVDVYLYAAAAATEYALVALWPEEMLYFWGQDQALIFKGIAEHIQSTALGHGNLGIETRTPLTGIKRDRSYPFREHMPADTALEEFAGLNRGMDYDTIMTPDNRVILATFYPQQGQHAGYTLVQGGNVVAASPERSRDVASSIIMQAQDIGSYRAEAYARDSSAFGGLLLERVVTAEQGTPVNELRDAARQELAWGRTSTSGWWLDIDPEAIAEVNANVAKGDVVRLILDYPRAVDRLARVINRERMPGSLRLLVAVEPEA